MRTTVPSTNREDVNGSELRFVLPEKLLIKTLAPECFRSREPIPSEVFRQVDVRRTAGRTVITPCGNDDATKDVAVTLIREPRIR